MSLLRSLKSIIPDKPRPMSILRGPFRGARLILSPRNSLRQIFGLYEHELNSWIEQALPRITQVLDVGASDGYFTYGCAAAMERLHKSVNIHAFEPSDLPVFHQTREQYPGIKLHRYYVGNGNSDTTITLNQFAKQCDPHNALVKVDVEGMELEVIEGATSWLNPTNLFLIEVHWDESFLTSLTNIFKQYGLTLNQVNQQPLPLIGRENRAANSWWLVSEL